MSDSFTLSVPVDPRYRGLAMEIAGKYAEMAGGSAADGTGLAGALEDALAQVIDGAGPGAHVDVSFRPTSAAIDVHVRCGPRSAVVRHPLPAQKS
jgi:hypothetical protein